MTVEELKKLLDSKEFKLDDPPESTIKFSKGKFIRNRKSLGKYEITADGDSGKFILKIVGSNLYTKNIYLHLKNDRKTITFNFDGLESKEFNLLEK